MLGLIFLPATPIFPFPSPVGTTQAKNPGYKSESNTTSIVSFWIHGAYTSYWPEGIISLELLFMAWLIPLASTKNLLLKIFPEFNLILKKLSSKLTDVIELFVIILAPFDWAWKAISLSNERRSITITFWFSEFISKELFLDLIIDFLI